MKTVTFLATWHTTGSVQVHDDLVMPDAEEAGNPATVPAEVLAAVQASSDHGRPELAQVDIFVG
jgi:hypothetical protein